MKEKISVALCTYNGDKFIEEQIDSILKQTQKVDEIIVCDDCSSDSTITILKEYENKYPHVFKIFINEENLKSVKNFEKALQLCTGDIIFLADQDDVWVSNKVASYFRFFEKNPTINVLASNGYCMDENSNIQEKYAIWDFQLFFKEASITYDYNQIITCISNIATGATIGLRKIFINQILPFPVLKDFHHDEWIAMVSSANETFHFLDEKYFYYRIHQSQSVGGIFHEKNFKSKKSISETFNLNAQNIAFKGYKKLLKRLYNSEKKNKQLLEIITEKQQILIKANLKTIVNKSAYLKMKMKKEYPIQSFFLAITDTIFKKKRL